MNKTKYETGVFVRFTFRQMAHPKNRKIRFRIVTSLKIPLSKTKLCKKPGRGVVINVLEY